MSSEATLPVWVRDLMVRISRTVRCLCSSLRLRWSAPWYLSAELPDELRHDRDQLIVARQRDLVSLLSTTRRLDRRLARNLVRLDVRATGSQEPSHELIDGYLAAHGWECSTQAGIDTLLDLRCQIGRSQLRLSHRKDV